MPQTFLVPSEPADRALGRRGSREGADEGNRGGYCTASATTVASSRKLPLLISGNGFHEGAANFFGTAGGLLQNPHKTFFPEIRAISVFCFAKRRQ